jgi:hypothetical protein
MKHVKTIKLRIDAEEAQAEARSANESESSKERDAVFPIHSPIPAATSTVYPIITSVDKDSEVTIS